MKRIMLAAVSAVLLLGGCAGFEPLYAEQTGVAQALTGTVVQTPATRTGHLLREELEDEFATAEGRTPTYRLEVDLDERRFARGLRIDDTANRYELRLRVAYRLFDYRSGRLVAGLERPVYVTYDVADAPYAGITAHQDGQERAASEAARVIRTDLARLFAGRAPFGVARTPPPS